MKSREFTIKTEIYDESLIEDYIFEDLEVPEDCVESLQISDSYVNIKLSSNKRYFNDDWYVNLQRVG